VASLDDYDIARVRADNPGPFSLSGTNTWVVGRDPAFVVDPGPQLEDHLEAIREFADAGYDHVCIHQVGPDQEGCFRFYEREVIPQLSKARRKKAA